VPSHTSETLTKFVRSEVCNAADYEILYELSEGDERVRDGNRCKVGKRGLAFASVSHEMTFKPYAW
jgi:hypothetical protein